MKINIEINIQDPLWQNIIGIEGEDFSTESVPSCDQLFLPPTITLMQELADALLVRHVSFASLEEVSISLLLTNDEIIMGLNNEYRNKHQATNVLSFPEHEFVSPGIFEESIVDDSIYLGDIAMSYQTISKEADIKSINFLDHFLHLYAHSLLHLIGYDHVSDDEADVMESIELEILSRFGIGSPYE